MTRRNPDHPGDEARPRRRAERIEILCFPHEKEAIRRRAGTVPLGRWARIQLQGKRAASPEAVPISRALGFAETIERLALEGDVEAILSAARSIQQHLRPARS